MGRQIRFTLPVTEEMLVPRWPNLKEFQKVDESFKQKQKKNFDCRHRAKELPSFDIDQPVFVATREGTGTTGTVPGRVVQETRSRSYEVQTPTGVIRRNRSDLHARPEDDHNEPPIESSNGEDGPQTVPQSRSEFVRSPAVTRSRTGTNTRPPDRLNL